MLGIVVGPDNSEVWESMETTATSAFWIPFPWRRASYVASAVSKSFPASEKLLITHFAPAASLSHWSFPREGLL